MADPTEMRRTQASADYLTQIAETWIFFEKDVEAAFADFIFDLRYAGWSENEGNLGRALAYGDLLKAVEDCEAALVCYTDMHAERIKVLSNG